jgi:polysaccharide biosynthesis protein
MVGFTSLLFIVLVSIFLQPLSGVMGYSDHSSYVWVMAATVSIDAFQCIPFAYLRYKNRPIKFAALKLLFVTFNIALNLLYFLVLPDLYKSYPEVIQYVYSPETGVGYAFYINLVCTASITFFFYKELTGFKYTFDKELAKRMLSYSWPILILGIAGILNQNADFILFPYLYKGSQVHQQLGIYGAASKIAMIMAMITQAFRYAYEPFVFGKGNDKDNRETYAIAMKYFIIFTLLAFLAVMGYINILRHIISKYYWEGLKVVPIVMAGMIMMGIYFNLSFWYKLIDKSIWGAYFSGIGCSVLILINIIFVPQYGYMACAWAGLIGYATAMTLSYFVGQKKYPINYPLKSIGIYVLIAVFFFIAITYSNEYLPKIYALAVNTLIIFAFVAHIIYHDLPLSSMPVIGKYFRKG